MESSELKKRRSLTWRFLRVIFADGITDGFKTAAPYGDVTGSPFNMPTELLRDLKLQIHTVTCRCFRQNSRRTRRRNNQSGKQSEKVNISLSLPTLSSPISPSSS
jgi:hypothetical protein